MDSHVQLGCYTLVRSRVLFVWIRQLATWQQPIPTPATQFWLGHNALMVGGYIIGRWCAGLYHYSHTVTSVGWRILLRNSLGPRLWAISACLLQLVMLCCHSFLNIFSFLNPPHSPLCLLVIPIHPSIHQYLYTYILSSIHPSMSGSLSVFFLLLYQFKVVISVFFFIFVKYKFGLHLLHK